MIRVIKISSFFFLTVEEVNELQHVMNPWADLTEDILEFGIQALLSGWMEMALCFAETTTR